MSESGPSEPNAILTAAIDSLADSEDLDVAGAQEALTEIMDGRAGPIQTGAFLIALRAKGETVDEVTGLAQAMRSLALRVRCDRDDLLDTAGTGGGAPTFNVSTTAALVAAGAGCAVAKHGNRSATSRSGSADVLEALGARIDLGPDAVGTCIAEVGFGFMFAPLHHPAMRHVVPVRRALAVRTIFNLLGPLTNPAGASRQLIGIADGSRVEVIAEALARLGCERALVVSSDDGLDEVSVSAPTRVVELSEGRVESYTVHPEDLGLVTTREAVRAGTPEENAAVTRAVLDGAQGPERSLTLANAAAAIYVAGHAESLAAGVERAAESIDGGAARIALDRFVERTTELAA